MSKGFFYNCADLTSFVLLVKTTHRTTQRSADKHNSTIKRLHLSARPFKITFFPFFLTLQLCVDVLIFASSFHFWAPVEPLMKRPRGEPEPKSTSSCHVYIVNF